MGEGKILPGDVVLLGGRVLAMVMWCDNTIARYNFFYDLINGKPFFGKIKNDLYDDIRLANSAERIIYSELLNNITGLFWKNIAAAEWKDPDIAMEEDKP